MLIFKVMQINKLSLIEGAQNATGLTVIIDVFRAFSTACYIYANGAEKIYPVGTVEEAFKMKEKYPAFILIGERHEKKCEGFDFGNSPTHILNNNFNNKSVILTTSSGTKGIVNALNADQIITGSFVNAKAIAKYIMLQNPKVVTLVSMGYEGLRVTQEDEFCADYIENEIFSIKTDIEKIKTILKSGDGARLFNPNNQAHSPSSDFFLCTDFNRFDFILKVLSDENGNKVLEKVDII